MLPSDVKRIHLSFAHKVDDGHLGARRVWRKHLPQLKYHNPAISMTVNRSLDQEGPATLTVFFVSPLESTSSISSSVPHVPSGQSTAAPGHAPTDRVATIDMKHKHESEILSRLLELTKAKPYEASPDELAELRDVDVEKIRSERDREAQAKLNEIRRREKALLDLARGGVEST